MSPVERNTAARQFFRQIRRHYPALFGSRERDRSGLSVTDEATTAAMRSEPEV